LSCETCGHYPNLSAKSTVIHETLTGELIKRAMSAETMKIPDPIIAPMTIMVASYSPMPRTKVWVSVEGTFTGQDAQL